MDESKSTVELQALFLREFPDYKSVFHQLVIHREFIEILNDLKTCELVLMKNSNKQETIDSYMELTIELKQDIQSCISRHLGNQYSKTL